MGRKLCLYQLLLLKFCCTQFEVHYLSRAAELILGDPAPFVTLLYNFEPYY